MTELKDLLSNQVKTLQKIENSLRNLRIADLELFISAARMGNLGKAAAQHHLSQSAASAAIQRVEASFGMELCTHERRRFALTREGQVLLPKIEQIVRQVRDLVLSGDEIPFRLVTTHAIAQVVVPSLLSVRNVDFKQMRPDQAYSALLHGEADLAIVLDNSLWKGVVAAELGRGAFQLYAKEKETPLKPILLPEDQMEVLTLQQNWLQAHGYSLPVKTRIPSWSLIAQICAHSSEVGFLPDFLAKKYGLQPVLWQPASASYRILGLYRNKEGQIKERYEEVLTVLFSLFV